MPLRLAILSEEPNIPRLPGYSHSTWRYVDADEYPCPPHVRNRPVGEAITVDSLNPGHIHLTWIDPPTGVLGPDARRTGCYVYQIFNRQGRKIIGGSNGPDLEQATARAKSLAAEKGMENPTVTVS